MGRRPPDHTPPPGRGDGGSSSTPHESFSSALTESASLLSLCDAVGKSVSNLRPSAWRAASLIGPSYGPFGLRVLDGEGFAP
jgi:hypothetical protein